MNNLEKQMQKIKSLYKDFDISQYLDSKEIRDEYLAQVLKDGDKDELSQALENIEKAKNLKSRFKKDSIR